MEFPSSLELLYIMNVIGFSLNFVQLVKTHITQNHLYSFPECPWHVCYVLSSLEYL